MSEHEQLLKDTLLRIITPYVFESRREKVVADILAAIKEAGYVHLPSKEEPRWLVK